MNTRRKSQKIVCLLEAKEKYGIQIITSYKNFKNEENILVFIKKL